MAQPRHPLCTRTAEAEGKNCSAESCHLADGAERDDVPCSARDGRCQEGGGSAARFSSASGTTMLVFYCILLTSFLVILYIYIYIFMYYNYLVLVVALYV
mgnify:CR=1 FL=1